MLHDHHAASASLTEGIATSTIRADELTEGDIIKHLTTGDIWQVASEPEYTTEGIGFEVIWLSDSQEPCVIYAQTQQRFELVDYKPNQPVVVGESE